MATITLPAINQNVASGWTEQQRDLYNYMPFYLATRDVKRRNVKPMWKNLVGKMKWTPNMGEVMKAVRKEPSPVIRQQAHPRELSAAALKDVMDVREMQVTATVKHHKFESPIFQFYPSFRDFMKNHVEVHYDDIMQKQEIFNDYFLRSKIFHYAPFVFLPDAANEPLIDAPSYEGDDQGTNSSSSKGKTTAWLQEKITGVGNPGNLSLVAINRLVTTMANDLNIPANSGENMPEGVSKAGLTEKFILITSAEAYNQFIFDPWLTANRRIDLDIVTSGFYGNMWGQVTCKLESFPMRIAADGTFPAPQVRVVGTSNNGTSSESAPYNVNESIMNPAYVNAPYEVAFLVGDQGYDAIEVGPPPKAFAGGNVPEGFGKLVWNGEIILTKNFLIPFVDSAGQTVYEANMYGEYVRFISHCTYGILPRQRRNIIPIIFKRRRGPSA